MRVYSINYYNKIASHNTNHPATTIAKDPFINLFKIISFPRLINEEAETFKIKSVIKTESIIKILTNRKRKKPSRTLNVKRITKKPQLLTILGN